MCDYKQSTTLLELNIYKSNNNNNVGSSGNNSNNNEIKNQVFVQ